MQHMVFHSAAAPVLIALVELDTMGLAWSPLQTGKLNTHPLRVSYMILHCVALIANSPHPLSHPLST